MSYVHSFMNKISMQNLIICLLSSFKIFEFLNLILFFPIQIKILNFIIFLFY